MKKLLRPVMMLSAFFAVFLILGLLLRSANDTYVHETYPLKYREEVEQAAAKYGVDKYLVYAVIKTESNFDPEAVSHAGAIGLMQLMPVTFEWMQTYYVSDEYEAYTPEDLNNPGINIDYGTHVLAVLIDMYGDEDTAICAYNAGIGNVDRWLQDKEYSEDGKTFIKVPIEETENYRMLVAQNKSCYIRLYEETAG